MIKLLKPAILLTSLVLFLNACKDAPAPPAKINPAFTAYISGFTSGVISTGSEIRIRLANPVSDEIMSSSDPHLLEFDPPIQGELNWVDNMVLEFIPSSPLSYDSYFTGVLNLSQLANTPSEMEDFEFTFKTMKQHMEVDVETIKQYDANDLRWQYLTGYVRTYDRANPSLVEQTLTANQFSKDIQLKWTHSGDGKLHYFTADSLERTKKASEVTLEWDGEVIEADVEDELSMAIPALGDFSILDTRIVQTPEQQVVIRFSDPLDPGQNLDGLLTIKDVSGLSYKIDQNEIRVFPPFRLSGTFDMDVKPGIENILGYSMKAENILSLVFEQIVPAVELLSSGKTILPSTDGLLFPFRAVSLKSVDVRIVEIYEKNIPQFLQVNSLAGADEMRRTGRVVRKKTVDLNPEGNVDLSRWNTFHLDINDLIETSPGSIYRVELGFRRHQSVYDCGENIDETADETIEEWDENGEEESTYWDYFDNYWYGYYYDDYYYDYNYNWDERDNPCAEAYYITRKPVATNILASDIGVIVKQGNDGSMFITVNDLRSTSPLSDAKVELLNYQQKVLHSTRTDSEGMVVVSGLEGKPFLVAATHDDQKAYVKLDRNSSLSTSKFDVSGNTVNQGVKGFIYGERGVWRPGDTLFLSFMLQDDKNVLPSNHPVTFELINPKGQVVDKQVQPVNSSGLFSFASTTSDEDITGHYDARVRVGGATFNKNVRIETIKPNRLKINLDFGQESIGVTDESLEGKLQVEWLHGAPARDLRTNVGATFVPIRTSFGKFAEYHFDDKVRRFSSRERIIFDENVDDDGQALIPMDVDLEKRSPGMLKAYFNAKAFEKGGEFSVDRFSIPYSPYDDYIGMKLPKGDRRRSMLLTDKKHTVEVVSCNSKGEPVAKKNLEWVIYEVNWRWWWSRNSDDLSRYETGGGVSPIAQGTVSTDKSGHGEFEFEVNYPEWGRYLVRIIDTEGGHATSQTVYIDWPGWAGRAQRENPGGAGMLVFSTDKDKYNVGDQCTITFPSSGLGRALVSVENGSRVIEANWVDAEKDQTSFSFMITPEMAPNVFLNVTLVQPHAQTANDLPIRMYGIVPIAVENKNTHLQPVIAMPDQLRPEEAFTLNVSEKSGYGMTYTVAVVDDGLLDLTRFKTPDPWSFFYAREAIGVKSFDIYDQVIGAFGQEIETLLSLGGGDDSDDSGGKNKANRFKPVVTYLGPFELKPGERAEHKILMPNYVGSVRTMVVARQNSAYGYAEKTTKVKKPLMVLATLPRVLGPSEEVKLPVTVFAMEDHIKEVSISVKPNKMLKGVDLTREVTFAKPGDKVIYFDLDVDDSIGIAEVEVLVTSGNEKASHFIELDVRNPNPEVLDIVEGIASAGESWETEFDLPGVLGTNSISLELSSLPPVNFTRRMKYLIGYPHGCLEQTTSKAFPQLFLSEVVDLPPAMEVRATNNVKAAIAKIKSFAHADGGMSYWPGEGHASDWGTSYAGHFLLEAEMRGYFIDSKLKSQWVAYQLRVSQNYSPTKSSSGDKYDYNDLAQAYRLYTLALANSPDLAAMNRLKQHGDLNVQAWWRLAAAYELAGQHAVALEITEDLTDHVEPYRALSYQFGSNWRDQAMIIETLTLLGQREQAAILVRELAERLSSNHWMSTQATAYSLMAISKFANGEKGSNVKYHFDYNGAKTKTTLSSKPVQVVELTPDMLRNNKLTITNESDGMLFARLLLTGKPSRGEDKKVNENLNMSVTYLDMDQNPISVSTIEQGTDFMARVTISNPGYRGWYREMALTQIFPSGWEIHNTRMDEVSNTHMTDRPTYQDIRDDRVHTYYNLGRHKSKTFTVLLNASYQGKFYLPTVVSEAMYDETINSRVPGQWVEVVSPGQRVAEK